MCISIILGLQMHTIDEEKLNNIYENFRRGGRKTLNL